MKHLQLTKKNSCLPAGNKTSHRIFFISIMFLILFSAVKAQNVSYNINSVPIQGTNNSAFGSKALISNTTGSFNTAVGHSALNKNTTGSDNTAIGYRALISNTTGGNNTANGVNALYFNTSGQQNTAVGYRALFPNTTGEDNTAIGFQALNSNTTGSANTAIGYFADVALGNLTNATAIGSQAKVKTSNTIQLGNTKVTRVFVGTGATATLVSGGLQIVGGVLGAGKVLTSDANGVATWQSPAGATGWSLAGNAGTIDGINFIGTADNVPLNIKVNNQKAGRIENDNNANTFYGYQSGNTNAGKWNTGIGCQALLENTTGIANTANGFLSLYHNTTGSDNTAIGHAALLDNTTGNKNTAIGSIALSSNTTGGANTAIGYGALLSSTEGSSNVAIGYNALFTNTTGGNNTAIGSSVLNHNTTGTFNTALGSNTLADNTTGYDNTAIGALALISNTAGNYNTSIGKYTLLNNFTGSNNTALGYNADVAAQSLTNATAIGYEAIVNANNKIRLGDVNVTNVETQLNFKTVSDGRFKDNISEKDVKGIEFIKLLRPVVYNFNTKKFEEFLTKNMPEEIRRSHMNKNFGPSTAIRQSGFIAQEVEKAAKEAGYNFNGVHVPENENDNYSLAYAEFVVPLVKAVQQQQQMIEQQQQQIDKLEKIIAAFSGKPTINAIALSNANIVLDQNAPNPFKDQTSISYEVPEKAGRAKILFYDAAGKLVKTVNISNKGKSKLNIFANDLSAGSYSYSLVVDGQVITKQMIKQ